jgi:hypothetical protein
MSSETETSRQSVAGTGTLRLSADDRIAVTDTVTGIGLFADLRQWDRVGALLADEVTTDYVSVFGGEVASASRTELLDQWRATLGGLDATQHQITNVAVTPTGQGATALSHVRATHWSGGRFGLSVGSTPTTCFGRSLAGRSLSWVSPGCMRRATAASWASDSRRRPTNCLGWRCWSSTRRWRQTPHRGPPW